MPIGDLNTLILPVSGINPCFGSSVVTLLYIAYPLVFISSCFNPKSFRDAPPAIIIYACTISIPVISSVTVCSTYILGFTSIK